MSTADKASNKAQELRGQAKEKVGEATNDEGLAAEGQADKDAANLKQAGEKIKDVFKR